MCQAYFIQIDLFNAHFNSMRTVYLSSCFTIRGPEARRQGEVK